MLPSDAACRVEFRPSGWSGERADILVHDDVQKFVCLVENKIHTGEHSEQLTRYRAWVEHEFPEFQRLFVFLTLRPETPSDSAYVSLTYALTSIKNLQRGFVGLLSERRRDTLRP